MDVIEAWATVASVVLTTIALAGTWFGWRTRELRRDEVLTWSNEAITALQTLCLICWRDLKETNVDPAEYQGIWFSTSILTERGRLFFRNASPTASGKQKHPAYRGHRARILDPLVLGHQIAKAYPEATIAERAMMCGIANECRAKFVSLSQKEVGRARTRSADTKQGGEGVNLQHLMPNASSDIASLVSNSAS